MFEFDSSSASRVTVMAAVLVLAGRHPVSDDRLMLNKFLKQLIEEITRGVLHFDIDTVICRYTRHCYQLNKPFHILEDSFIWLFQWSISVDTLTRKTLHNVYSSQYWCKKWGPLLLTFHHLSPVLGGGVIADRFPGEVSPRDGSDGTCRHQHGALLLLGTLWMETHPATLISVRQYRTRTRFLLQRYHLEAR